MIKIGIFPVLIAYRSGFGIFKQNHENPDEIGMVRQSGNCNVHVASIRCHTGTMNLFHVSSQTAIIATTYAYYSCTLDNHEF